MIITYHSIDSSGSVISTAPEVFRIQLRHLKEEGYKAVTLGEFASVINGDSALPLKSLVLTFDDGFQNFRTEAVPVLEELGFKATVFLVTDKCGKYNDWQGNPPELPRSRLLDWSEIKELSGLGYEFGVHTRTHPDLTRLSPDDVAKEVTESRSAVEDALGREVRSFAYPYGRFDTSVRKSVMEHYDVACSTKLGLAGTGSDKFALERVDSYYLSNERVLRSIGSRSFEVYMKVRQTMRNFKSFANRLREV